jgi:hypothetical protein
MVLDILIDAATSYQPHVPVSQIASALNNINTDGNDIQQLALQTSEFPYGYRYVHLCHIPMFPLYGPTDTLALQKAEQRKAEKLSRLKPEMAIKDKIMMTALSVSAGGGLGVGAHRKFENGMVKLGAKSVQTTMDQNKVCVLTRWAVRPATEQVMFFVDVLEYRFLKGWKGNQLLLKTGKDAPAIRLFKKSVVKGLKPTKTWTKLWCFEHVDAMWVISVDKEVEMEIVAREERICSAVESREVQRRFKYEWWIPTLV